MVGMDNPLLPENQLFQQVKIFQIRKNYQNGKTLKIYQILAYLSRFFLSKLLTI
jgi:hypothetical protein